MKKYNPTVIEKRWQTYWQKQKTFLAKDEATRPKKYILVEFPYPSGDGLHMGHLRPYVAGDLYSRYCRLKGFETMYPMGWDAFGLPAENYAIKHGVQPAVSTAKNIKNAKKQIQSWGLSFDWSREINTTDPNYYKWTQWLFLQFYKAGLAYEATGLINWCPKDKTGLANEEVIDGKCERCGTVVVKKQLRQWYLKITAYAEKLLDGLKTLAWPEAVVVQQENWIGKSVGAEIDFPIKDHRQSIRVFTTRPETIFGATYMVLAPEHRLIAEMKAQIKNWSALQQYLDQAVTKQDLERTAEGKEKTGIELKGIVAINPATGQPIPIWVADYVLANYGTGAIMAVPAHDERDREFAEKYDLPIKNVLEQDKLVDSGKFSGILVDQARPEMAKAFGQPTVQFKLRDWVFSRQRYWGEPIPIIHCSTCGIVPVPEKDLPVVLPTVKKYQPTGTGQSPLAPIDSWVNVKCPDCGAAAKRETNTMPQWAGSSWYYLRYADPQNQRAFANKEMLQRWLPVDIYFGGMEHTTLHLLYSRFWNLFLHDHGLVPVPEPYTKRIPHGIVLAADGEKMSKSRGNVVNPDMIVKSYGADTLRMYELFLGPHEMSVIWNDQGIVGVKRFLDRVWVWVNQNAASELEDSEKVSRAIHKLIKKVGDDIEIYHFNTCVSAFMEFYNEVKDEPVSRSTFRNFLILLYPFVPHITEELHLMLGGKKSLQLESWPSYDPELLVDTLATIVLQINGKVKASLEAPVNSSQEKIKQLVMGVDKIQSALNNQPIKRWIIVPNKLVNIVL